jgi:hypothetical protein
MIRTARWRGGKMLDRGEKRELDRLSRDDHVVRLRALVEQEIGVRLQPGKVGRRLRTGAGLGCGAGVVREKAPRPVLEDPQAGVGRDLVEPGAEGGLPPIRRTAAPGAKERVLERVLGVLERAEHAVGVHLELTAVALDELRERSLVPGSRRADDLLFDCVGRRRPLLSVARRVPRSILRRHHRCDPCWSRNSSPKSFWSGLTISWPAGRRSSTVGRGRSERRGRRGWRAGTGRARGTRSRCIR